MVPVEVDLVHGVRRGRGLQRGGVAERPGGDLVLPAAERLAQVTERWLARAIEVRPERSDREQEHEHDHQDAGRGGQHEQPLPAQTRPPLFAGRAPRAAVAVPARGLPSVVERCRDVGSLPGCMSGVVRVPRLGASCRAVNQRRPSAYFLSGARDSATASSCFAVRSPPIVTMRPSWKAHRCGRPFTGTASLAVSPAKAPRRSVTVLTSSDCRVAALLAGMIQPLMGANGSASTGSCVPFSSRVVTVNERNPARYSSAVTS